MRSLDEFATAKLGELERSSLRRALVDTTRVTAIWLLRNGRRLLSFCCNDYLNLTHHPAVKEAAIEALRVHGVGAGASRFVTGNHPMFSELEARLARLKETQAACVFGSGYLANLGIIPALIGPDDGPQPDFSVAVREAALLVILTSGPTGYDDLTRLLTDIHGVEGWAAGSSTGLASAVRTELYTLRHRLWALHLLGSERSFTAPLSLTKTGVAAALSALLARALRPRHHLGLG
jgi:hypothetical protein